MGVDVNASGSFLRSKSSLDSKCQKIVQIVYSVKIESSIRESPLYLDWYIFIFASVRYLSLGQFEKNITVSKFPFSDVA